ncbi:JAB domain-containing protein [Anaerobacillus alkaliphilus]|uniref:JAB domain-containing protein n=1 Tax=Anaerobacillus alkaliphilus TaxID=1548597 RepID=A0A4Q0VQZ3_9BACI|nr:DNA repair protein RadC [Anaerobacillus alkaliphilus]RXI98405.1 JAB domain-containing protein [Anaerobacillus alkaliphilus]
MGVKPLMIRDVPTEERPREKMLKEGVHVLTNQELIAIILGTGTREESVLQLAQRILYDFQGLRFLRESSVDELTKIKGIGNSKAVQLLAALELGSRVHKFQQEDRIIIRSPEDVSRFMMEDMRFLTQEHFVALYLNTKNHVIHKKTIFIGSLNASIVHPREVFKEAFRHSAASIICLHNHPSGDPAPSKEDIEVTKRLVETGKVIGIEMLDHIIIGDRKFVSLKEKGYV